MWVGVWLVNNNIMLFYLLYCFVIVISASSGKDITSQNVKVSSEGRIAGGEDASDVFIPYQVQISREGESFCSGVLYNEEHILTAAHCVQNANPDELVVRVGSEVRGQGMVVPIEKIVPHPDYDYPQNNFDIAVLRTTIPLVFTREMHGVLSVDYEDDDFGDKLQVSGWGYQGDGKMKLSDDLRYAILPIIGNVECGVFYPTVGITQNMICGYSMRDMDKGACVGDGGSPAVIPNTRILLGISSFTAGCGPGMGPSVFTFVQARDIREFIVNNTIMEPHSGNRRPTVYYYPIDYKGPVDPGRNYYADGDYDDADDTEHSFYGPPGGIFGGEDPEHSIYRPRRPRPTITEYYNYYGDYDGEHGQPGHRRPEHEQSGHGQPGHGRPEHEQSGHGQPGHGRPEHEQSGHGQPGHMRPEHGQSGNGPHSGHRRPTVYYYPIDYKGPVDPGRNYYADGLYDDASDTEHSFYGPPGGIFGGEDPEHSIYRPRRPRRPEHEQSGHGQPGHMRPEHGQSGNGPHSGHRRPTVYYYPIDYKGPVDPGRNYYADGLYDDASDTEHSFYGPPGGIFGGEDPEHSIYRPRRPRRPEHEQSGHGQPGHGRPEHEQSGHGQPGHMRPEHGQSGNGQTGHGQPEHGHSGHRLPGHRKPGHGPSTQGGSEHGQSEHGQSGHGQHEHGQPEHGQSRYVRPAHGQSEDERPESSLELPKIPSEHKRSERPSEQTEDEGSEEPSAL